MGLKCGEERKNRGMFPTAAMKEHVETAALKLPVAANVELIGRTQRGDGEFSRLSV